MLVVTVLQTRGQLSPEFAPRHVQALQAQIAKWSPEVQFACLSDAPIPGVAIWPLRYGWPGWWAKLELCRPTIFGDFLYMDLDTIVRGPIEEFFGEGPFRLPLGGSALMFMPEDARARIWADWDKDPQRHIREQTQARRWDTGIIGRHIDGERAILPEKWYYNRRIQAYAPPESANILLFSGRPRPWNTPQFARLYR